MPVAHGPTEFVVTASKYLQDEAQFESADVNVSSAM
jgi:hypothetical protein